ncbi:DMT family transporter [Fictibacillus fluitans]|uniref:DMT family transporter n=1 Tax=Fictibacillus fluitans TaxID=3058422 RepID=A0ABT8HYQ2_9BACL|nr:DMT family transporter [Fictibacillus sp. NE201]MDN4525844.1 DMT family transporter [Fictibacillus sp. NE201]
MPIGYVLLLLLTSLFWGGNFVISKSLIGHASPMTLTSLRWIIAVICLFPIVWRKEKRLLPPKAAIVPMILMGLTGVVLFNVFQFVALHETTATNAGLISTLNAISIAVCSSVFLKERLNKLQVLAMLLSLTGVLLVLTKGEVHSLLSLTFNRGDLWMVGAVCIWGMYSVFSRWATMKASPLICTLYSGMFGLLMLLPFNAGSFTVTDWSVPFTVSLLYTGIVSTVLCMLFWNIGVQKLGAGASGIFLNFNPIFTSVLAYFLLGEQLTWTQGAGSLLVIGGCILFSLLKNVSVEKIKQQESLA